ncbi:MAG: hypothetical protein ACXV8Q_16385 [Methylobacter sp.]
MIAYAKTDATNLNNIYLRIIDAYWNKFTAVAVSAEWLSSESNIPESEE